MSTKFSFITESISKKWAEAAREHGFTRSDCEWVLREAKRDFQMKSREQGNRFRPSLLQNILKDKTESMVTARRLVNEVLEELGLKKQ